MMVEWNRTSVDELGLAVLLVGDDVDAVGALVAAGAIVDRLGLDVVKVGEPVATLGWALATVGT